MNGCAVYHPFLTFLLLFVSRQKVKKKFMQRIAFKMKFSKGCEDEYKKRHDEIWDELKDLLKQAGIKDYSIFLDEETNTLFAYLTIADKTKLDELPNEPVMQKWWAYMKDIMETNEDNSPVNIPLKEVFYLP
jgi:L-rhamnose mutarotase